MHYLIFFEQKLNECCWVNTKEVFRKPSRKTHSSASLASIVSFFQYSAF